MTTRIRKKILDIFADSQYYIHKRVASLEANYGFDKSKKPVRDWLEKHGVEDEDGNLVYEFPRTVTAVDNKRYSGVMLKRNVGAAFMVEDEVRKLLDANGKRTSTGLRASERAFKLVEVLDEDEVYVLQQEGVITEEELRSLLHYPKPSYSLWPIENKDRPEEDEDA